jgi:hypothetical protein
MYNCRELHARDTDWGTTEPVHVTTTGVVAGGSSGAVAAMAVASAASHNPNPYYHKNGVRYQSLARSCQGKEF